MDPLEIALSFFIYYIPFLFALSFHEFAHGWVALLKGDPTQNRPVRSTLNPRHMLIFVGHQSMSFGPIVTGCSFF